MATEHRSQGAAPQGPAAIFQMLNAAQVTAVVSSAIELKVFGALAGQSLDADAVARKIDCPARTTRILLDAMNVLGLAAKEGKSYRLTPLAEEYLVPDKPTYVGDMAGIIASPTMWSGLSHMAEAVKQGGSILHEHAETPKNPFWETFAKCSGSMALGASAALEGHLHDWIQKRGKTRVLDIAAGSGIYGFTLARKNANVELTSLDWPNVLVETRQWAKRLEIDPKRVKYLEGSLFDVDYGGPHDVILLSHIYHHFDRPTCEKLTKKVAAALAPGGRVVIHEFLSDSPVPAATMFSLTMLVWTQKGEAYTSEDYRGWLTEAGLANVTVQAIPDMPSGLVMAEK